MNIRKVNIRLVFSALALVSLLFTSCREWDEHYDAGSAVEGSATATIWENITANPNLSQFAALVQKAGYDELLKSTQTLTVWAPLNDTFDYEALMSESNETLRKEFVQNHIARNNYPASGQIGWSVSMLNLKHLVFEGNGNYTMDGIAVAQPNVASANGVLHALNGKLQFRSNILESLNNKDFPIDSISDYYHSYDVLKLNESKSTAGPVVDGQLTYLDSVFDEYNMLTTLHKSYIEHEDSNYSMVVPSNEAWEKAMKYIRNCYNYVDFTYLDHPSSKGTNQTQERVTLSPGPEYWNDSISHFKMLTGLFYNNNLYDNKKLNQWANGEQPVIDSLMTTRNERMYTEDAMAMLRTTTPVKKSNGAMFFTGDSLHLQPWIFWNPMINVEAEHSGNVGSVENGNSDNKKVTTETQNPDVPGQVSKQGYVEVSPQTNMSNVEINFYLKDVRSTTYVLYIVFVPANITNRFIPAEDIKPNQVQVQLGSNRANGTMPANPTTLSVVDTLYDENGNVIYDDKGKPTTKTRNLFSNDPSKVDTVCFGEITFPICYYDMAGSPFLRVLSRVPVGSTEFDRTVRIDRVFLLPKELDTYMKEHPDYKVHY